MRNYIKKIILDLFKIKGGIITYYSMDKDLSALHLISQIKREVDFLLSYDEAYNLYFFSQALSKLNGNFAEVGCYQGGSTKLILNNLKKNSKLFVFDTFEGLTEDFVAGKDSERFKAGQFSCSLDSVQNYLKDSRIVYTKGVFPDSARGVIVEKFSFVHLDLDLYQATIDSLRYFYPLMVSGGVILTHDYSTAKGVRIAYDEFAGEHNLAVIPLSGSQAIIVRV